MGVFRGSRRTDGRAEVGAILTASYLENVIDLIQLGALVSTGTTRDGGAVSCTVTYDGDWNRDYVRDEQGMLDFLHDCAQDVREAATQPAPPSRSRGRKGPEKPV